MLNRSPIKDALLAAGYAFVGRSTSIYNVHRPSIYRALRSSHAVEHFLYLGADMGKHQYFAGWFGLRAPSVEDFSIACLLKYGHPNFSLSLEGWEADLACTMAFDLSRFDLARGIIRERILLSVSNCDQLLKGLDCVLTKHLMPTITPIVTLEDFHLLLVSNTEPCPWFASNRALRAAQIVAVGEQLGTERSQVRQWLVPFDRLIAKDLRESASDEKAAVDRYVARVAADWSRWHPG